MHNSNLYKYVTYEAAEAIITGKHLMFNNPVNFNDPFDCVLARISTSISDKNIDVRVNTDVNILREKFGGEVKNLEKIEEGYQKSLDDKIKRSAICCFSLTYENPLMWAHYANNHKGICLAFSLNTEESPFPQFPNNKLSLGSVDYPKENNSVNYLSDKTQGLKQLFFTKSAHWEYEEEFRIQTFTEPGLYRFNDNFLKGIIFGLRIPHELRERFKRVCVRSGFNNLIYQKAERIRLELTFEDD